MNLKKTSYRSLILISILILLTRIPFLFNGFGGEEDAWGIYIVTQGIASSNIYEYSRMPGHPMQELIYALLNNSSSFLYNLLTAFISTIGIFFFMLSLKKLKFKNYLESGLLLAFIPIIYINSTNSMDYLWALGFILVSFYSLISRNFILSGALIGLAVGCRITSGAILFPFILFILLDYQQPNRILAIVKLSLACFIISLLSFLPVIQNYGNAFFNYYEHFSHPALLKILFNATIGIFGGIGLLSFVVFASIFLYRIIFRKTSSPSDLVTKKGLLFTCSAGIAIFIVAYFSYPFKGEFLIPTLPFLVIAITMYLTKIQTRVFLISMIIGCFFVGVNLINPLRGTTESDLSYIKKIESNIIALDILKGPILADKEVRKNQIAFTKKVIEKEQKITKPSIIICGWWYNFLIATNKHSNHMVNYVYYEPQSVLLDYKSRGFDLFYLPEQDVWNNKRFKSNFTKELASPFFPQFEYQGQ